MNFMLALAPLLIPVWSTCFLFTGPHPWWQAILWVLPMGLPVLADFLGCRSRQPNWSPPAPLAAVVLGGIAGLFIADLWLLLEMSTQWQWKPGKGLMDTLVDLMAVKLLLGSNGAHSSLLVGHELVHRQAWIPRGLGRLLLTLSCYHHFAIEHIHGHHRRVGRVEDPATARLGESYNTFWWRSVTGQFKSAWQLENRRLRAVATGRERILRNQVLHGVLAETGLIICIAWIFGPAALLAYAIQTVMAIRNLEAINYIQHWGLSRGDRAPDARDAWYTDTWCSTHLLLGLVHHAHHHRQPAIPYPRLRSLPGSPRMPYGYFTLMFMIAYRNPRFQALATAELQRLGLGPFSNSDHHHPHHQIHSQGQTCPQQGIGELMADVVDGFDPGRQGSDHGGVGHR